MFKVFKSHASNNLYIRYFAILKMMKIGHYKNKIDIHSPSSHHLTPKFSTDSLNCTFIFFQCSETMKNIKFRNLVKLSKSPFSHFSFWQHALSSPSPSFYLVMYYKQVSILDIYILFNLVIMISFLKVEGKLYLII